MYKSYFSGAKINKCFDFAKYLGRFFWGQAAKLPGTVAAARGAVAAAGEAGAIRGDGC